MRPNRRPTGIDIFIGPDTITPVSVVYKLSKSQLKATVSDNVPGGAAVISMTPLDANGIPLVCGSGTCVVVMTYDPTANVYNVLQNITNPIPNSVRFTSSYGAVLVAPISRVQ